MVMMNITRYKTRTTCAGKPICLISSHKISRDGYEDDYSSGEFLYVGESAGNKSTICKQSCKVYYA